MASALRKPLQIFFAVWLGQTVSMLGSLLTWFALGVLAYQRSGAVTDFGVVMLCTSFFEALGLTISGSVVDRRSARNVMIAADAIAGVASMSLAALYLLGMLELWHVCIAMAVNATCVAFQGPAFNSVATALVPADRLVRANGMISASYAGAAIAAPFLASMLIARAGLGWIFVFDVASFLFAITMQAVAGLPRGGPVSSAAPTRFRQDLLQGWRFIFSHPGLVGLVAFMSVVGFLQAMAEVLFTPMILKMGSVTQLGTTMTVIGCGILAGSLFVATWGGPTRKVRAVIGLTMVQATALFCAGLRPSLILLTACATTTMFFAPVISSINAGLWQLKSPTDLVGRIYAARYLLAISVEPIGQLCAGPLADRVFEPAMAPGGVLADSVGRWIGVGPGRGMGLMLSLLGVGAMCLVVAGLSYRRLRRVERDVPDHKRDLPDPAAANGVEVAG